MNTPQQKNILSRQNSAAVPTAAGLFHQLFHRCACRTVARKTTDTSAEFEIIKAPPPPPPALHEHFKELLPECTVLKVKLLQDHQICCLQACMRALFSLENVRAGAVKGLKEWMGHAL